MHTRILGHLPLLAACLAGAAHTAAAQSVVTRPGAAVPANYLVAGLSEEYSTNILRASAAEESAWTTGVVSDFQWSAGNHPRFAASLAGTGAYYHYQSRFYDSEFTGTANGSLAYELLSDTLTLLVDDSLTQTRVSELAAVTPDNRQNVNRLSAGPELRLHPGGAPNLLVAQGFYELTDYSEAPLDSDTVRGLLSVGRSIDARNLLSVNAAARDVGFDAASAFPDYRGEDYYLSWTATGIRTTLLLDAGYSSTRVDGAERVNSPLFRLNIARRLSPRATGFVYATHSQVSAADATFLDSGLGGRNAGTSGFGDNPDPFKLDYLGAGYQLDSERLTLAVRIAISRERYSQTTIDDRNDQQIEADVSYRLNSRVGFGAFAEYSAEEFVNRGNADADETMFGVFAGYAFGSRLALNLTAVRLDRSGDLGVASGDETRLRAMLTYTIVGTGQEAPTSLPRFVR